MNIDSIQLNQNETYTQPIHKDIDTERYSRHEYKPAESSCRARPQLLAIRRADDVSGAFKSRSDIPKKRDLQLKNIRLFKINSTGKRNVCIIFLFADFDSSFQFDYE